MSVRTPMNIALVIGSANRGGAEGQLVRLACRLAARGHQVRVLFLAWGGPLTDVLDDAGVEWTVARPHRMPSSTGRNVVMILRAAALLWRWRPDVLYGWLAGAIWPTFLVSRPLRRCARVAAFRGEVEPTRLHVVSELFRWAVRGSHAVTVNAPQLREHAISWGADIARLTFVPNGVAIPDWSADPAVQPPTAVVVANFRSYKGHEVLAEALARVTAPLHVRLVGEGEALEPTRRLLADLGVAERVVFVTHPADVPHELKGAQFAIHPSRAEGLSNAILEEMAAGLPVVATDVGGTSLLIQSERNGTLVPPGDPQALANAVERLAVDVDARRRMGMEARRHSEEFSWDTCVLRTEEVLRQAIAVARSAT